METNDSFEKASQSLQEILAEIEPFIKRPVVREHITRGKWNKGQQPNQIAERIGTSQNDEPSAEFLLDETA